MKPLFIRNVAIYCENRYDETYDKSRDGFLPRLHEGQNGEKIACYFEQIGPHDRIYIAYVKYLENADCKAYYLAGNGQKFVTEGYGKSDKAQGHGKNAQKRHSYEVVYDGKRVEPKSGRVQWAGSRSWLKRSWIWRESAS